MRVLQIYLIKLHLKIAKTGDGRHRIFVRLVSETEPAVQANQGGTRVLNNQETKAQRI
jgi:hypothetical protein